MAPMRIDPDFLSATPISTFIAVVIFVTIFGTLLINLLICACCCDGGRDGKSKKGAATTSLDEIDRVDETFETVPAKPLYESDLAQDQQISDSGLSPPPQIVHEPSYSLEDARAVDVSLKSARLPSLSLSSPRATLTSIHGVSALKSTSSLQPSFALMSRNSTRAPSMVKSFKSSIRSIPPPPLRKKHTDGQHSVEDGSDAHHR